MIENIPEIGIAIAIAGLMIAVFLYNQVQKTKIEKIGAESMDNFEPYVLAGTSLALMFLLSLFGLRYTPW